MVGQQSRHMTYKPMTEQDVDCGDIDRTGDVLCLLPAFKQHRLDAVNDGIGMGQEDLSAFGRLIAGVVADEKSDPQSLLGCRDPSAHGGSHQAQVARRLGHVAGLGEFQQQGNVVPIEVHGASTLGKRHANLVAFLQRTIASVAISATLREA
ncbi:hypothetical protein D3C78_1347320 [compost metagenome]